MHMGLTCLSYPSYCLQLSNLELAINLAKRGNLPGAENLVSAAVQTPSLLHSSAHDALHP